MTFSTKESFISRSLVAASVTLTKLNRALYIKKQSDKQDNGKPPRALRMPSACNKLSNAAQVRLVCSSERFQGCFFFQVYANNLCRSFLSVFFYPIDIQIYLISDSLSLTNIFLSLKLGLS